MNIQTTFNRLKQAVIPGAIAAELEDIAAKLAVLDAEREEHRLAAAEILMDRASTTGGNVDKAVQAHHDRIAAIQAERRGLKALRRQLQEDAAPPPVGSDVVAGVAMPAELKATMVDLEKARSARLALIRTGPSGQGATSMVAFNAECQRLEDRIRELRVKRQSLIEPYHLAVTEALAPLLRERAEVLREASAAFIDAMTQMSELAQRVPPVAPGMGNGYEGLGGCDIRGALYALTLATRWAS